MVIEYNYFTSVHDDGRYTGDYYRIQTTVGITIERRSHGESVWRDVSDRISAILDDPRVHFMTDEEAQSVGLIKNMTETGTRKKPVCM